MAETLFLVNKGSQVGATFVNEINACLINSDDGDTDAVVIAAAEAQCVAAGHAVPGGYFDTVLDIGAAPGTGALGDDDDCYIFGGIRAPEKVEG
tara:strand:- start:327 stop:608 length:282 start_codon:yes stop_codon:yes gene_type:complete